MCFGSSKKADTTPPPPSTPTTFSYRAGAESADQQKQVAQSQAASTAAPSFGSELSGSTPAPAGG